MQPRSPTRSGSGSPKAAQGRARHAGGQVESIAQLRRICQDPVRQYNDLAGQIYGWPLSIYVTRLLLRLRLQADHASCMMFSCGLIGSMLLLAPGGYRVLGFAFLTAAFILDCVDGEMARYSRTDSYRWTAFDHLHHLTAKGLAFTCLGAGLYLEHGTAWTLLSGPVVSLAWLALMIIRDVPSTIFVHKVVLNDNREKNPAYRRLTGNLSRPGQSHPPARPAGADTFGGTLRRRLGVVRMFFTSFDLVMPLFLIAAACEPFLPPVPLPAPAGPQPLVSLLLYGYALLLPLHTLDVLYTAMWRGRFRSELYEMAGRVERFRERI